MKPNSDTKTPDGASQAHNTHADPTDIPSQPNSPEMTELIQKTILNSLVGGRYRSERRRRFYLTHESPKGKRHKKIRMKLQKAGRTAARYGR